MRTDFRLALCAIPRRKLRDDLLGEKQAVNASAISRRLSYPFFKFG
jgi:hypothetical protein